jgi:hypothetical protein
MVLRFGSHGVVMPDRLVGGLVYGFTFGWFGIGLLLASFPFLWNTIGVYCFVIPTIGIFLGSFYTAYHRKEGFNLLGEYFVYDVITKRFRPFHIWQNEEDENYYYGIYGWMGVFPHTSPRRYFKCKENLREYSVGELLGVCWSKSLGVVDGWKIPLLRSIPFIKERLKYHGIVEEYILSIVNDPLSQTKILSAINEVNIHLEELDSRVMDAEGLIAYHQIREAELNEQMEEITQMSKFVQRKHKFMWLPPKEHYGIVFFLCAIIILLLVILLV